MSIDMSGANYVGRGSASLEIQVGGASGTWTKDAKWDAIRLNEIGRTGPWSLDFNDVAVSGVAMTPARAYIFIQMRARPVVGTVRAKVTCEIWKPDRSATGERIRSSLISKDAEVVFDRVELVRGGALVGRIAVTEGEVHVRGRFDLRLDDPPPLLPATN